MQYLIPSFQDVTLQQARQRVVRCFEQTDLVYGHGVEDAEEEALWLVLAASNEEIGQSEYPWSRVLDWREAEAIKELLSSRLTTRQPLAYILKEAWFSGMPFYVDHRVLVPRSFMAEWIPQQFAPWIEPEKVGSLLDLCCGSGCIGISAALNLDVESLVLSDLSIEALQVAGINCEKYLPPDLVKLNHGDMFDGIEDRFDLILCNPPYVSTERMATLPLEYINEPDIALRAGDDGLAFIAPMLQQVRQHLTDQGVLIVEAGSASNEMERVWPQVPFTWLGTEYDEMVLFMITATELDQYQHLLKIP